MEAGLPYPNQSAYRKKSLLCKFYLPPRRSSANILKKGAGCTCASMIFRRRLILLGFQSYQLKNVTYFMQLAWYIDCRSSYTWDSTYHPPLLLAMVCDEGPFCHLHCSYWSWTPFEAVPIILHRCNRRLHVCTCLPAYRRHPYTSF